MSTDKTKTYIALIALLIYVFAFVLYCYAGEFRMVQGLIESVTDDTIEVNGTHYNISNVPIKNFAEKRVSKDQLKIGRIITIYFLNNYINAVIIYDEDNMGG